jgi:streptomycin 6-kinase
MTSDEVGEDPWAFTAHLSPFAYPKVAKYAKSPATRGFITRLTRQFTELADTGLEVGPPLAGGVSSLAFAGRLADRDVVVKCHRDRDRTLREVQALTCMAEAHAVPAVLGCTGNAIILERVLPGIQLRAFRPYPDTALQAVGALLERIAACPLPRARRRVEAYALGDVESGPVGQHLRTTEAGIPPGPFVVCDALAATRVLAAAHEQKSHSKLIRLCHGDFHDGNLLTHDVGWMAIDPRDLVVGDPHVDVGRLAVSVALGASQDLYTAVERICAGTQFHPDRAMIWARVWALQVLGFLWGVGVGDSPQATACRAMLTAH